MLNLLMIAIGLSMDAFAVSTTNGMCVSRQYKRQSFFTRALVWSAMFGLFQGLMPMLGYFLGKTFASFISSIDHWIAFILLGFIGGKMIWEAVHPEKEECEVNLPFSTILTRRRLPPASMHSLSVSKLCSAGGQHPFCKRDHCTDHPALLAGRRLPQSLWLAVKKQS